MILTDYYKGEHLPDAAKTRFDVTASTGEYDHYENKLRVKRGINKGGLSFHYGTVPANWHFANPKDKPDMAITKKSNISSVWVPDITVPFAFGDNFTTTDAILLIFSNDWKTIEIFIARGQRNNKRNLYNLLCDHELDAEIEILRNNAKK